MLRNLINETPKLIGQEVKLAGWVNVRRDHGKIIFIDLRDRSGIIQAVVIPDNSEAYETAKTLRSEYVVEIVGLVKERPMSARNEKIPTGGVEMEVRVIKIMERTEGELPIDISQDELNLNLETLLDNRMLTLRHEKVKAIFKVYAELLKAYDLAMNGDGFTEIKTPKILSAATEGGANFFKIKYFNRDAYLAQSPQFYKQAGVGIFERVFEIGPVFRAEPHFTSRHMNEYISLDAEIGFIENFEDIMRQLERTLALVMKSIRRSSKTELALYGAKVPAVKIIPRLKLTEALQILENKYGKKMEGIDIDPEGERLICEYARKKYKSDFVFLTHYPSANRPFYTMPSADPQFTESFDLLFRGVEIATGGQRIHNYQQLVASIKKHKLNPDEFKGYLDIFKNGMPPHGGWGLGSERIIQKILGLKNVKEAALFPRDVKRLAP